MPKDLTHDDLIDCLVDDFKSDVRPDEIQGSIRIDREGHPSPELIAEPAGGGKKRPDVHAEFTQALDPDDGPDGQLVIWEYIGEADLEIGDDAREQIAVFMRHAMDDGTCRLVVAVPSSEEKNVKDAMFSVFTKVTGLSERSDMDKHLFVRKASCGAVLVEFNTAYPLGGASWS